MAQHDGTHASLRPISDVARDLKIATEHLEPYGRDKAKVRLEALEAAKARHPSGKLILVSAITPTPAGEGKTTTSIGLSMGLNRIGHRSALALRQPSMGPVFGRKGARPAVVPAGSSHPIPSTSSLLATSTRSPRRTTCSPPQSTTGSISAISTLIPGGFFGNAPST